MCSEADGVPQEASGSSCPQPVGGKRKREEEAAAAEKVPKKRRASQKEPETIIIPDNTPEPPRRGRGARGRTRRQQQEGSGEEPKAEVVSTPAVPQKDDVIVLDSPSPSEHTSPEGEWNSTAVPELMCFNRIVGANFREQQAVLVALPAFSDCFGPSSQSEFYR